MDTLTKEDLNNSKIIFDTCTLIEMYNYPNVLIETLKEKYFEPYSDNFHLPYQVHIEYHSKKETKKYIGAEKYSSIIEKSANSSSELHHIEENIKKVSGNFNKLKEATSKKDKHPFFEDEALKKIEELITKFETESKDEIKKIKALIESKIDSIEKSEDQIEKLVETYFKLEREFEYNELFEIANEGEFRYRHKIPPGWADAEGKDAKESFRKFGDLFVWKQILEISESYNSDVIFVTNDISKDDWCNLASNPKYIKSPKYELTQEINHRSGKNLKMFSPVQFFYLVSQLHEFELETSDISDVDSSTSFKILAVEADNSNESFWGVSQKTNGKCYLSNNEIRLKLNTYEFNKINQRNDYKIQSLNANLASINKNRKWHIIQAGEKINVDVDITDDHKNHLLENIELVINREKIPDLNNKWIVFQIDINRNGSISTMYLHWKGL